MSNSSPDCRGLCEESRSAFLNSPSAFTQSEDTLSSLASLSVDEAVELDDRPNREQDYPAYFKRAEVCLHTRTSKPILRSNPYISFNSIYCVPT